MSFFENTRKPAGLGGKLMVTMMNIGHRALAGWGLQFLSIAPDAKVPMIATAAITTVRITMVIRIFLCCDCSDIIYIIM